MIAGTAAATDEFATACFPSQPRPVDALAAFRQAERPLRQVGRDIDRDTATALVLGAGAHSAWLTAFVDDEFKSEALLQQRRRHSNGEGHGTADGPVCAVRL